MTDILNTLVADTDNNGMCYTCGGYIASRDGSAEADGARHIRYKKKGQTHD